MSQPAQELDDVRRHALLHLLDHLVEANDFERFYEALTRFDFIRMKTALAGAQPLIADYRKADSFKEGGAVSTPRKKILGLIADALRLSSHILNQDADELSGQLVGRLLTHAAAEETERRPKSLLGRLWSRRSEGAGAGAGRHLSGFLEHVRRARREPWLCPLTPSLHASTSPLLWTLAEHFQQVNAVKTLPDNLRVVSANSLRSLKVWDLTTGMELLQLEGHEGAVNDVAVTPDGRFAVSASDDSTVRIWELERGREVRSLRSGSPVQSVAVTADSRLVISGDRVGAVKVWELGSGREVATLLVPGRRRGVRGVSDLVVSRDGRRVVASIGGRITAWDLPTGEHVYAIDDGFLEWKLAIVPPGRQLVCVRMVEADDPEAELFKNQTVVRVMDMKTGAEISREVVGLNIAALAPCPDGRHLLLSLDGPLLLVEWPSMKGLQLFEGHNAHVFTVDITPDGSRGVSGSWDGAVRVWDLANRARAPRRPAARWPIQAVAFSEDGDRAVSVNVKGRVDVWDVQTGEVVRTCAEGSDDEVIWDATITPDARLALLGSWHAPGLKVCDTGKGKIIASLPGLKYPLNNLELSADGRYAVTTYLDRDGPSNTESAAGTFDSLVVKLWDLKEGEALRSFRADFAALLAFFVTAEGQRVVITSGHGGLSMWDVDTRAVIKAWRAGGLGITAAVVNKHATRAILIRRRGLPEVWDLRTAAQVSTLDVPRDYAHLAAISNVSAAAVSHDGTYAVTLQGGSVARGGGVAYPSIYFWDVEKGSLVAGLTTDRSVTCCALSPGGDLVAFGDESGRVHFARVMNYAAGSERAMSRARPDSLAPPPLRADFDDLSGEPGRRPAGEGGRDE
jgi:WD40 repeat protein